MESFNTATDEMLWEAAAAGGVEAEEELVKRYSTLVRVCARPLFLAGGDSEDLIQEGMLGLLSAVRHYCPDGGASFKTYAERCIKNRLLSAVRSASRFKHKPLNDSVSIESPQFDEALISCYLRDPEELVITRELTEEISIDLNQALSAFENKVLGYYLDGLAYGDIAGKTGRTVKSVDNAVQRIRKKLAQLMNSGDFSIG